MLAPVEQFTLMGAACAALSVTLAKSKVFEAPRDWLRRKSALLGDLAACPYCQSHWYAAGITLWLQPRLIEGTPVANFVIISLAIVAVSALICGAIMRLLFMQEREIERLRARADVLAKTVQELLGAKGPMET